MNTQQHEVEYHRQHAKEHEQKVLGNPFSYGVLDPRVPHRWWNAHWAMCASLDRWDLSGKRVLVLGYGFGQDVVLTGRMGAKVYANDLIPESLSVACRLASRECVPAEFIEVPAESLPYDDGFFDCVVARDILHHTDVPRILAEVVRVPRPGTLLLNRLDRVVMALVAPVSHFLGGRVLIAGEIRKTQAG